MQHRRGQISRPTQEHGAQHRRCQIGRPRQEHGVQHGAQDLLTPLERNDLLTPFGGGYGLLTPLRGPQFVDTPGGPRFVNTFGVQRFVNTLWGATVC